ncbi:TPA: hypothetical protein SML50_004703 [Serratia fonticola]|nr:hypothetical protein [Serratia fonticola]
MKLCIGVLAAIGSLDIAGRGWLDLQRWDIHLAKIMYLRTGSKPVNQDY